MAEAEFSDEFLERRRTRPVLRELSSEAFAELVSDAGPPTDDDRPRRFPVKVRMEKAPDDESG
jgi:hypothetical protein